MNTSRPSLKPGPKAFLESLEPRLLLSAATDALQPLALLPNEATVVNAPKFSDLWHLRNVGQTLSAPVSGPATGKPGADINAEKAWNLTTGNNSVVIAVFDTGVDLTNPELVNNLWRNPGEIANNGIDDDGDGFVDDVYGWNFVDGNNNVQDTSATNHGTAVAGVLGAQGNNGIGISGVDWNVDMLTIKVGTDSGVATQDLLNAISYVNLLKSRGVNIVAVNASFISLGVPSLQEFSAIQSLGNNGILYVSAAGNSALDLDSLGLPLILPSNEIVVAATDNQDQLGSFSSYGKNSVALGAPGVDILTTLRGGLYAPLTGTSFAGPMVSGAIGLMKSLVPSATMSQLKAALLAGVDPVPSLAATTISGGRLDAWRSLEILLGEQPPLGSVDVLTNSSVAGWAFDYNAGQAPVTVQVVVDGFVVANVTANNPRPDLGTVFGSTAHGFSVALPSLFPGSHSVQVFALDAPGVGTALARQLIGQGTISGVAVAPIGSLDLANAQLVAGWALDQDTPATAVSVRIDIDGVTAATIPADVARPDLLPVFGSANHGYVFALPALSVGTHQVAVYALDTSTAAATLLGSQSINTNIAPWGRLDAVSIGPIQSRIAGWALDPNTFNAAVQIEYQIDANVPQMATANITRPDLGTVFGSADHGFDIQLPGLQDGFHVISVWAKDSTTGDMTLLGQPTATVLTSGPENPTRGSLDFASNSVVTGWAYDGDAISAGAGVVNVRIDVDGVPGTPVLATAPRADLVPTLPDANHGFSINLNLSAGMHRLDVYAIGETSTATGSVFFLVLLGSRLV